MISKLKLGILLLAFTTSACGGDPSTDSPGIVWEHPTVFNSSEVKTAVEDAKRTLPLFFKRFENPQENDFEFRVLVRKPSAKPDYEFNYVWVSELTKTSDGYAGVIMQNARDIAASARDGDKLSFNTSEIYDWGFINQGIWGSFTTLAKMETLSASAKSLNGEATDLSALKSRYRDVSELIDEE